MYERVMTAGNVLGVILCRMNNGVSGGIALLLHLASHAAAKHRSGKQHSEAALQAAKAMKQCGLPMACY